MGRWDRPEETGECMLSFKVCTVGRIEPKKCVFERKTTTLWFKAMKWKINNVDRFMNQIVEARGFLEWEIVSLSKFRFVILMNFDCFH